MWGARLLTQLNSDICGSLLWNFIHATQNFEVACRFLENLWKAEVQLGKECNTYTHVQDIFNMNYHHHHYALQIIL